MPVDGLLARVQPAERGKSRLHLLSLAHIVLQSPGFTPNRFSKVNFFMHVLSSNAAQEIF